ncbi:Conserved_hypothetical protein [Hexamita inflata]|uniref:Uncharacterized protein n=1 Tax=Hexamita inflata TaxID=28002 RepID=A0AA86P4J2_9EUKA|nr:Conserved hypothetical protein [Hexamita inflata]
MQYHQLINELNALYHQYQSNSQMYSQQISEIKQEITGIETQKISQEHLKSEQISILNKKLKDLNLTMLKEEGEQALVQRARQEISEIQFLIQKQREDFERTKVDLELQKQNILIEMQNNAEKSNMDVERLMIMIQEKEMLGTELSRRDSQ